MIYIKQMVKRKTKNPTKSKMMQTNTYHYKKIWSSWTVLDEKIQSKEWYTYYPFLTRKHMGLKRV